MISILIGLAFHRATVQFVGDGNHLKGIYVNGACILGDDIRTGGGYLIGSADGSDAQGRSVNSIGGSGGRMLSDNPRLVTPPRYRMDWQLKGPNRVAFAVSVGPVDQDFATISFPFDFGLKSMESFSFDGSEFKLFCSENDGVVKKNESSYAAIRPKCEIRDIKQNLIGKVAGASTEAPTLNARVDGPYATVDFKVTSSKHYEKLVFMNHPGTHNIEFSFGRMKKGESAALSGELVVTPKAGPDSWTFEAIPEFNHQVGRAEADGWSVRVGDERERYMCFGPYATEIGSGPRTAIFRLMLDNVSFDNAQILTIDVADAVSQRVLATRDLSRGDFARPMEYQAFALPFLAPPGGRLEFRTLWHGASYAREKDLTVRKG
ncbi:hypothetical protein [Fimbriimonas ginsengisoli]|uniref:Uncharacterized protein n=1 Tax=Fimbriimonas ginsengisoli Gsoil 348 TaxID=661478 RepID=A0A068NSF5_FIMGI|nr:hypothetical protein [Fimbriimonas ginsengisoli]AIE86473.1 hypothetical protein OP10G_3105 [Fimbriimonas ginsengisoli Gsoil 348]